MLQKGDILLWHENRYTQVPWLRAINILISELQEDVYAGDYVHAAIVIDPDTLHVVEMLPGGIHYSGLTIDDFIESDIEYFGVNNADQKTIDRAVVTALDQLNRKIPYDFIALTGLFYTDAAHALYCVRQVCLCYPTLWARFKDDKLISPDELFTSGLIIKKGSLSREQLPDYWASSIATDVTA